MHGKHEMLPREKPNLSLNAKFCISKHMACFLKVFRLMPCFSKCKILNSETDSVFHARHVNAQESIFVKNPSISHAFFLTFPKHMVQKNVFLCKKLMITNHKSFNYIKILWIDKIKKFHIHRFDLSNCVLVCTVT